jgi:hypothetical protein
VQPLFLAAYARFGTSWRAASDSMSREVPLKSMLMPTSVPMTHSVLDGQVRQIITARISVITPSKSSQPAPASRRR